MSRNESARISPTAHYTSFVWFANGLSHPSLATPFGRLLHGSIAPWQRLYNAAFARESLDAMLLARHRLLDDRLERAVAEGRVGQVLEVAAGLSPRGFTFTRRHPELRYVEADLSSMAEEKRGRLLGAGLLGRDHSVLAVDALADAGPESLSSLAGRALDPSRPLAVITEGLLSYFDRPAVLALWRRIASLIASFPGGVYLADMNLAADVRRLPLLPVFIAGLSTFARGRVHLHFEDAADTGEALRAAGFPRIELHAPGAEATVRIVEAWAGAAKHVDR